VKVPSGVRATVLSRDKGRCVRCGMSVLNRPSSVHHRLPRRMGGTKDERSADPRNLVTLCDEPPAPACHREVESYRSLAYETGWLIRSYDDLDTPLITKDGRRVYLLTEYPWRYEEIDVASVIAAEAMQ
jgi:hypothetical protein